ncbi:MAG: hypothetical protein HY574_03915 [candidate division NC10 bacterium]|nr:hypothetical protein [candidate division NC10 bacterium]
MRPEKKICFISAPSTIDLRVLHQVLAEHGYEALVPDQLETTGRDWSEILKDHFRRAELIVGVLPAGAAENVCYEVGLAHGLGKRVLLVVAPERRDLPFDLLSLVLVRTSPENRDALSFAIEQLAKAPPPRIHVGSSASPRSGPLGQNVSTWLQRLAELRKVPPLIGGQAAHGAYHARRGIALEDLVGDLLREVAGLDVVAEARRADEGWDFVVWSDRLEPFVGNPLAVEVKTRVPRGTEALRRVTAGLTSSLRGSNTPYALLLYLDGPDPASEFWRSVPPSILPLRLDTLVEALRERSFEEVIRDLRNQRVHGVGR